MCLIKGQLWRTDAAITTTISLNASSQPRTDLLILQYDRASSTDVGVVQLMISQGTPSASPQPPALIQNAPGSGGTGVWQIAVAQWTMAANNGAVSGFLDKRQYNGHAVITMTSVNRPVPPSSRIGLEIDTGYVLMYDTNVNQWRNIGPKNQIYTKGNLITGTAPLPLHTEFPIMANDVINATLGTCAYRVRCGGGGHQAASPAAAATFIFALSAWGVNWGATSTGQIIPVGQPFNWHFDIELSVNADGSGSLYGDVTVSQATANPGNAQSVYNIQKQISSGGIPVGQATNIVATAYTSKAPVSGVPSLQCIGATYERISN
jgi:hypothetical protein